MPIATGKRAALLQERGPSAKRAQADLRKGLMSSSSQEPSAPGKPAALFSFGSEEPGNQFKSSFFRNANPSNLGRSLLQGNEDHNIKLDLSIIASVSYSNMLMLRDWNYKTHNTDTLTLDENEFVYKKSYL